MKTIRLLFILALTSLAPAQSTLSERSIEAWFLQKTNTLAYDDSQFFPDITGIDTTIPRGTLTLGTRDWPGYLQVLRHGYGTSSENAVWMVSGNHYSDHAHPDDGSIYAYFMKVPLFIDAGSNIYNPHMSTKLLHSTPVLNSELSGGQTWNGDLVSFESPAGRWGTMVQCETLAFTKFSMACMADTDATGTVWTRKIILSHFNPTLPIFGIFDTFAGGSNATAAKTMPILPLFNGGVIQTPFGAIAPAVRSVECNASPSTAPSGGTANALSSGLQAFSLVGFMTPTVAGISGNGIDADFQLIRGTSSAQVAIGAWKTNCTSNRETAEFAVANGGAAYSATHAWIRVNDTGSFTQFWEPHYKNVTPSRTFSAITGGISNVTTSPVSTTETMTSLEVTGTDGTVQCLASFDTLSHTAFGVTISGGPQEICKLSPTSYTWRVTGRTAGTRTFMPPTTLYADKPVLWTGSAFQLYHPGGEQQAPYAIAFSTVSGPRRTISMGFKNAAADSVRVRFGSATEYVGAAACPTPCALSVLSPTGNQQFSYEYLSSGSVIAASGTSSITIQ